MIFLAITMLIFIGFCLLPLLGVGAVIYAILIAVKANEGKWDKYWLAGDWAANSVEIPYFTGGMN